SGVCQAGACASPSCADGIKNGGELAVDCGGSCAAACPDGTPCAAPGDCASGVCSGPAGATTGAVPTCSDRMKSGPGAASGRGGGAPWRVPPFYGCLVAADCLGGLCSPTKHTCTPSCTDG